MGNSVWGMRNLQEFFYYSKNWKWMKSEFYFDFRVQGAFSFLKAPLISPNSDDPIVCPPSKDLNNLPVFIVF